MKEVDINVRISSWRFQWGVSRILLRLFNLVLARSIDGLGRATDALLRDLDLRLHAFLLILAAGIVFGIALGAWLTRHVYSVGQP